MENTEEKTGNENTGAANVQDDKLIGILSYLFWPVAYFLFMNKKNEYNTFHVRQGLGIIILYIVVMILAFILVFIPIIGALLLYVLYIAILVLWIMGLISAIQGTQKPLPLIGDQIQDILKGIK